MREMLRGFAARWGAAVEAEDRMDDGSPIRLRVQVDPQEVGMGWRGREAASPCAPLRPATSPCPPPRVPHPVSPQGSAVFDFSGSGHEVYGNCNAPRAITLSALIYCLRCMVGQDIPLNQVGTGTPGMGAPGHVGTPEHRDSRHGGTRSCADPPSIGTPGVGTPSHVGTPKHWDPQCSGTWSHRDPQALGPPAWGHPVM